MKPLGVNIKVFYEDGREPDVLFGVVHCNAWEDGRHVRFVDGRELFLHGVKRVQFFREGEAEEMECE